MGVARGLPAVERLAKRGEVDAEGRRHLGLHALVEGDFADASEQLALARSGKPGAHLLLYGQIYALCMQERCQEAARILDSERADLPGAAPDRRYWQWMNRTFDLPMPLPGRGARQGGR